MARDGLWTLGRGIVIALALMELALDGLRIPRIALEVLTGADVYPGTTGWRLGTFKFWASVVMILALPIGALMCLGPRRLARAGAVLALVTTGLWCALTTADEVVDAITHYATPPIFDALVESLRLAVPKLPLLVAAVVFLAASPPRRAWRVILVGALVLATLATLAIYGPILLGGTLRLFSFAVVVFLQMVLLVAVAVGSVRALILSQGEGAP